MRAACGASVRYSNAGCSLIVTTGCFSVKPLPSCDRGARWQGHSPQGHACAQARPARAGRALVVTSAAASTSGEAGTSAPCALPGGAGTPPVAVIIVDHGSRKKDSNQMLVSMFCWCVVWLGGCTTHAPLPPPHPPPRRTTLGCCTSSSRARPSLKWRTWRLRSPPLSRLLVGVPCCSVRHSTTG
jgi:hypothetical protein